MAVRSQAFEAAALVGAGLALAAAAFVITLTPVADSDLFWHLAAGREMVARGEFLRTDPFTISAEGRPWIDLHWLFQLFVYGVWQLGGLQAIVIAKAAVVALGAVGLLLVVRRGLDGAAASLATPLFVLSLAAALFYARYLVLARPVIFTLVFLAAFLYLLEDFARGGSHRRLYLLPVLQIVWVNCQGLFALGPAVIAAYAVGGAIAARLGRAELPEGGVRRLGGAMALCLGACLITPYGWAGFVLPIKLLLRLVPGEANVFSANIAENIPPFVLERTAPGSMAHLQWVLALVGLSFLATRAQLRWGRTLVVLGFAALALAANRNVLLFYWVAVPIAVMNVAPALVALRDRLAASPKFSRAWTPLVVAGLASGAVPLGAGIAAARAAETPIAWPAPFRVPAAALAALPSSPPAGGGRLFVADHYGGYVAWAAWPRYRAFIDTRLVLHTGEEYAEFLGLLEHPLRFDAFARTRRFDHVLVPSAFPDRYLGLIQHLGNSPDWRLDFTDGTEVLFTRVVDKADVRAAGVDLKRPAVARALSESLDRRADYVVMGEAPRRAAQHHLARLLLVLGQPESARVVLERLPSADAGGQALLARVELAVGRVHDARRIALALHAASGDAPTSCNLLALADLAVGDLPAALAWLRRSLAVSPFDAEALGLLDEIEAEQRRHTTHSLDKTAPHDGESPNERSTP